jgi:predicted Zn-dependent protease
MAQEPGLKHFMLLQRVESPTGRTLEEVAARSMSAARFRRTEGQSTSLNGADAYVGVYHGELDGLGRVVMRAAHIQQGRQVLLLAGFAPESEFARVDRDIATAIQSYRPLTQREADQIHPNRLDFYVVRAGDSWQSIAARGGNLVRATDLAIMNSHAVADQPEPGQRIKIVVEG